MRPWVGSGVLACALVFATAAAQDEGQKPGATQAQDEGRDALKKGLQESVKAGAYRIEGRVEQNNDMGGFKIGGFGDGGLEGKFTGVVGPDGTVCIKLETERGAYELFKRGDRIVQRQTWTGRQEMVGGFPREVCAILNFPRLLKQVEKAKGVRRGEKKAVGGADCTAVKAELPKGIVADDEDDDDDAGMPMKVRMFDLKKVEATVYVGDADSLVRRIDVKLTRGLGAMVRFAGPGGPGGDEEEDKDKDKDEDEDEDEDDGGMPGLKGLKLSSSYSVTFTYDKEAKVELPEDVKKFLRE